MIPNHTIPRVVKCTDMETKMMVARGWEENEELLFTEYRVLVLQDENNP